MPQLTKYRLTLQKAEKELHQLQIETDDVLLLTEKSIEVCLSGLAELRKTVATKGFLKEIDEILFFKEIKPKLISHLIYHNSVYKTKNMIRWTGSKVALVELMYALHTSDNFNNGQADVKAIAAYFEKIFDVELGNYYRVYLEMKIPQNSTKFLNSLANSLERRMQEEDEN